MLFPGLCPTFSASVRVRRSSLDLQLHAECCSKEVKGIYFAPTFPFMAIIAMKRDSWLASTLQNSRIG